MKTNMQAEAVVTRERGPRMDRTEGERRGAEGPVKCTTPQTRVRRPACAQGGRSHSQTPLRETAGNPVQGRAHDRFPPPP